MTDDKNATVFVADLDALVTGVASDSIISRTVCRNDAARVMVFGFAPGQELSEHTAAKPAMLYFVRGTATLTLGDEVHAVEAGAFAYMPPNLPHSITAHTETVMQLILLEQPDTPSAV
jgi:quercetin dioxygenase-like cupin family protein